MQEQAITDDEISLLDIYDFLVEGWKTILAIALIGTSIGIVTSMVLPEQFEAKALIESAKVASLTSSTNSTNSTNSAYFFIFSHLFSLCYSLKKLPYGSRTRQGRSDY